MTCATCNTTIEPRQTACPKCGTPVAAPAAPSTFEQVVCIGALIGGLLIGRAIARRFAGDDDAQNPSALPAEFADTPARSAYDVEGDPRLSAMLQEQHDLRVNEDRAKRAEMWMRHSEKMNDAVLRNLGRMSRQ